MIFAFVFLKETYAPVILERKAARLRKETGNNEFRSTLDTGLSPKTVFYNAIVRPTKMMIFSPIVMLLSLYMALIYGYLYLIFTALPALFKTTYHFSTGSIGLSYLGLGFGSIVGLLVTGATSDRTVTYLAAKYNSERKPEYRLPIIFCAALSIPIGLFWFGWTGYTHQHWILPIIGLFWLGLGMTPSFVSHGQIFNERPFLTNYRCRLRPTSLTPTGCTQPRRLQPVLSSDHLEALYFPWQVVPCLTNWAFNGARLFWPLSHWQCHHCPSSSSFMVNVFETSHSSASSFDSSKSTAIRCFHCILFF